MLEPRRSLVVALVLGIAGITGCADGTLPAAASPDDPSSPSAPEAPFSRPAPLAPAAPVETASAPAGDVVYTCPMHPQIVRDAPGQCPICGMTLVPRPKGQEHAHPGPMP